LKKDLKYKMKHDEFQSGIEIAALWVKQHRDEVRVTAAILVVLGLGAGVLAYIQSRRATESNEKLAAAMEIYGAPLTAEVRAEEKPTGPVFATAKEKYEKAVVAFDGVQRQFGSTAAGVRARYYGALCRVELGQADQARKDLTEIAAQADGKALEPTLARLALADLLKRAGQTDQAVDAYRALAQDKSLPIPRDHVVMTLAETLELAHRFADARAAYKQLVDDFPASPYAGQARQRAAYLETAGQG
jgi:hypothetical protein